MRLILMMCFGLMTSQMVSAAEKEKPTEIGPKDVYKHITTIEEYLTYIDLKKVHISNRENGAPGLLIAIPGHSVDGSDVLAYYFKSDTGLTVDDFDNKASASIGTTGGGWSCIKDELSNKAEIDILSINKEKFNNAKTPEEKLKALGNGQRFVPMPNGGIETACKSGADVPIFAPWGDYKSMPVYAIAIWRNRKGDNKPLGKADAFDIYSSSFGGDFVWEKTKNGKVTNAQTLIDIYKELGFEYSEDGLKEKAPK
jgi:hypothetical protein